MTFTYALQACVLLGESVYVEKRTVAKAESAASVVAMTAAVKQHALQGTLDQLLQLPESTNCESVEACGEGNVGTTVNEFTVLAGLATNGPMRLCTLFGYPFQVFVLEDVSREDGMNGKFFISITTTLPLTDRFMAEEESHIRQTFISILGHQVVVLFSEMIQEDYTIQNL